MVVVQLEPLRPCVLRGKIVSPSGIRFVRPTRPQGAHLSRPHARPGD